MSRSISSRHTLARSGFGLVELLVALAVSALLIAGVLEIFLGTRQSYRLVSAQSQVQESGRFAAAFLNRDLRVTGYPFNDPYLAPQAIYTVGALTADGGGNASDTVTVMYQTNPLGPATTLIPTTDCLGNSTDYNGDGNADYPPSGYIPPGGGVYAGNPFYAKNRYLVLPSGNLACIPYDVSDNPQFEGSCTLSALTANPITVADCEEHILVGGIDNMQILYGVDTDIDLTALRPSTAPFDGVADLYQNATAVTTAGDWSKVVSLRIELLVNSGDSDGLDTNDTTTTYTLLDAPAIGPFNDRLSRSIFSTTVILRNRSPIAR
ncbi:PilW family protein [Endothiovibrio diazotrophicus]